MTLDKKILIAVCALFVFIFSWTEVVNHTVYGSFLSDEMALPLIEKHYKKGAHFNGDMIYIGNLPYISKTSPAFLSTYHIKGVGRIPVWSKSHKRIEQIRIEILNNL